MNFYTRPKRPPQVIIVSLIDILAILLIFVIVTTTFRSEQPEVLIKLPESSQSASPEEQAKAEAAVLTISKEEKLFLNSKPVLLAELGVALAELKQTGRSLALNADEKAPLGLVVKIMDAAKVAGFTDLPLWTETAPAP